MKTIILGKRSYLSNKLQSKIHKSRIYNFTDFENFIFKDKSNFNLIINSFYPSKKISKIKSFKEFYTQSIGNLSNLLDTINSKKINKIIYTSSASVYGSVNEPYYSSDNNNRTLYSSAKLLNEALLNNFCQKRNINLIIVRLFNMYGPKENFSIIYKLINSIKKNEKISLINKGQSTRDFIHVDDVVDIYLKLLKIKKSAIYDVGSGFGINIMQILNFLKIPKNKILYKKIKVDEISSSIANLKKLREDINKDTFIKLETFLKKETNIKINGSIFKKNTREAPNTINKNISGSIIYGSGFAGKKIASKLIKLKNNNVSFFVDDDPSKIGKSYLGKKIISKNQLINVSKKNIISNIIIAIPSLPQEKLINLYTELYPITLNISALPNKKNLKVGHDIKIKDLKKLDLGDIIQRKVFDIKSNSIKNFKNKCILITGGAGSIGSEISEQILKSKPRKLLIIDNSEYSLFKIKKKLGSSKNIKYILLDINNQKYLTKLIKENNISYIFHAAAYKHVSILEDNLMSAVINNVYATYSLLKSIKNLNINLSIISTDKAVEPKNILGMTKRASEMISLAISQSKGYERSKISVARFGNVFGSAGSAVEIFKNQILKDQPVTLTDTKMSRYFMSIREACNLVLQVSQLKYSSLIFILKMGKPIKILDLINRMFNLLKTNNQKLKIKIIGKFKSEKINEKLSTNKLYKTKVNDISFIKDKILNPEVVENFLSEIDNSLNNLDNKKTLKILKKFINLK